MGAAGNGAPGICCGLRSRPAIGGIIKTNYVLIDYESVQPEIVSALKGEHFKILMFIAPNQVRIDINVATALQVGKRAEYIRVSAAGRNALDFHIAYYLGRLAVSEPDAYFHVIAVDKGYDPLIEHLRRKGIHATRCADVNDIPIVRTSGAAPADDKLSIILALPGQARRTAARIHQDIEHEHRRAVSAQAR